MVIALIFYYRIKDFLSTDQKPQLAHFSSEDRQKNLIAATEVKTGLYIKNFPVFDLIENKFVMDAIVWFEFNSSLMQLDLIEKFYIERATQLQKSEPEIRQQGDFLLVKYNIKVEFSTNLDHTFFPMNDHTLYIVVTNDYVSPNEMIFVGQESFLSWSGRLYTSDWKIVGKAIDSGYAEFNFDLTNSSVKKVSHPRIVYSLTLAKTGLRKAALIFLPVFFILLLGTFSLTLDAKEMGGTVLSLSVGSLTGLLAYRFVIEKISPNIGYFTLAERIYTIVLSFSFLTFLLNVIQVGIGRNKGEFIPYLDGVWLYSMQGLLVIAVYYLLFIQSPFNKRKKPSEKRKLRHKRETKYESDTPSLLSKYNMSVIKNISKEFTERPPIDNNNWLNPDYNSFYKEYTGVFSIIERFYKPLSFAEEYFLPLANHFLKINKKYIHKKYVCSIPFQKENKVIIFGDIHGAFHSLTRNLEQLIKLKLLNEDLTLCQKDTHILFNGNVIDQSPYVLETLTTILVLMIKNPGHVFYIRGEHENNKLWLDYNTYQELRFKLKKQFHQAKDDLIKMLDDLFSSLPIAIFVEATNGYLCVTHSNLDEVPGLSSLEGSKDDQNNDRGYLGVKKFIINPDAEIVEIKGIRNVIIKALSNKTVYGWVAPFRLLPPYNGNTTWSIFSSPNGTYYHLLNFSYDTFGIINTHADISEWLLTLYFQDVNDLAGYKKNYFHLLYGVKLKSPDIIEKYNYKQEILLGSSLDLSKSSLLLGNQIRSGTFLGMLEANLKGGIKNSPVRLVFLDDYYAPYRARKNIYRFLEVYKTNLILSPVGTATIESFIELIREQKILVLFPSTGAEVFRDPKLSHIINFRPSYGDEAKSLIKYAIRTFGIKKFGLFYQNDDFGISAVEGAKQILREKNYQWIEAPYERNSPNIDEAAKQILKFNPTAILLFSTHSPSVALMHKLGVDFLADKIILGVSYLTDTFRRYLQTIGLQIILSSVVPNIYDRQIEIVNDFHQGLKNNHFGGRLTATTLEGYINFSILSMVLEELDPPVTKEEIIAKLESIKNLTFKGIYLNFKTNTRELSETIWIDKGHGDWIPSSEL